MRAKIHFGAAVVAVSASFGLALDSAHAEGPTLSDVLANSGITTAGYLTTGYTGSFNKGQTLSDRVFDSSANSFTLNQAALIVADTPAEGFGGKIVAVAGSDAKILNAFYGSGGSDFALFIAYAQYAHGPFTAIAGRFPALSGAELALEPLNTNISRSLLLALAQPVPLTGARITYKVSDMLNVSASISNSDAFGSAAALDDNSEKASEAGFSFAPNKALLLNVYNYYSQESEANGGRNDIVDVVGSWQVTKQLAFVVNGDYKKIFTTTVAGPKGSTSGVAGYINYQFTPKISASLHLEALTLKNDQLNTSNNIEEATLTGTYKATNHFRFNGEFRYDNGSVPDFADGYGVDRTPVFKKNDGEIKVSAIYSFGGI